VNSEQWESMDEIEVIRDALVSSNTSLAMSVLQWRKERGAFQSETMNQLLGQSLYEDFVKLGHCLVYQTVCLGEVQLQNEASHIIDQYSSYNVE
jgi:hypothetical protein